MYPVRIAGERIVLRDLDEHDLDASMAVVGDPDVTSSLSFDTRTREEQAERLAADIARAQTEPRPDYYLAIADRPTDELIGFIRIGLGGHRSGELGYALRKDRWRQGYTYEAANLMLNFGAESLGLHRIQAACGPDNIASQAMLQRLGFEYEGRLRDHVFHTWWMAGFAALLPSEQADDLSLIRTTAIAGWLRSAMAWRPRPSGGLSS